jgi:hypothetical protein
MLNNAKRTLSMRLTITVYALRVNFSVHVEHSLEKQFANIRPTINFLNQSLSHLVIL